MSAHPATRSAPPQGKLRRFSPIDLAVRTGKPVRKKGFWAGWGGIITTLIMSGTLVALLVGWVALWVDRPGGPSMALLILGCIGFSLVIAGMATLLNRLQAHWRLRQAEAAFLTGASHNLRTPIAAIRAAAQALDQRTLNENDQQALVSAIVYETRRLGLRVDNVLETGRLEVEPKRFQEEIISFSETVHTAVYELREVVGLRAGSIDAAIDDDILIRGDGRSLRLLMDNLLDNALNYADETPQIEINLKAIGDFALLQMYDQGIGFDAESQGQMFKRFRRGDTGRSGTGLGLPLSRAIARGHGGELHLFSDGPGKGAIAEIWLPLYLEG